MFETLIWIVIAYVVGCISMFTYVCVRLRQFGWTWKMITCARKNDKLREYYQKKYCSYEIDPVNFKGEDNGDKRTE